MPQTIYIKDYDTEIEIPDGADMAQVQAALQKQFPAKNVQPEQTTPSQPPVGGFKQLVQNVAPYARPALEMGGALAGAALAAPGNVLAPGLASLAGAGLGYAGGRQVANALDEYAGRKAPSTLSQALASTALAIPEGAAMEAGGAVMGKGIQAGLKAVAKAAPRIWESVAKIPPRSVDKVTRDKAVATAIENKIVPNEKGFKKLGGMIDETNAQISKVIQDAEATSKWAVNKNTKLGYKEFDEGKLSIPDILRRLESVRQWAYKSYADPAPVLKMLREYKAGIMQMRGKTISPGDAQALKQGIYRRLTDAAYGEFSTPAKEMDKAFARGIKEEIVEKFPQLKNLNAKDSALINLANVIEGTVNRTRNWDLVGLTDLAGSGIGAVAGGTSSGGDWKKGGEGAAIGLLVARALRSPAVMARLAFAMSKAAKTGLKALPKTGPQAAVRAMSYGAEQIGEKGREQIAGQLAPAFANLDPTANAGSETLPAQPAKSFSPSPARNSMQAAIKSYLTGNYDGTIDALTEAMQQDPKLADSYRNMLRNVQHEQKSYKDYMARKGRK